MSVFKKPSKVDGLTPLNDILSISPSGKPEIRKGYERNPRVQKLRILLEQMLTGQEGDSDTTAVYKIISAGIIYLSGEGLDPVEFLRHANKPEIPEHAGARPELSPSERQEVLKQLAELHRQLIEKDREYAKLQNQEGGDQAKWQDNLRRVWDELLELGKDFHDVGDRLRPVKRGRAAERYSDNKWLRSSPITEVTQFLKGTGKLGQGAQGLVSLAQDVITGHVVAVKTVPVGENRGLNRPIAEIMAEAELLMLFQEAGLGDLTVKCYAVVFDPKVGVQIVLEYLENFGLPEEILQKEKKKKLDYLRNYIGGTCRAIDQITAAGADHGDFDQMNILMEKSTGNPKIIDPGVSSLTYSRVDSAKTETGRPAKMHGLVRLLSNEGDLEPAIQEYENHPLRNYRKDLFAFAVTLFEVITEKELVQIDGAFHEEGFAKAEMNNLEKGRIACIEFMRGMMFDRGMWKNVADRLRKGLINLGVKSQDQLVIVEAFARAFEVQHVISQSGKERFSAAEEFGAILVNYLR